MAIEENEKKFGRLYKESYKREVVKQVEQEGSISLVCHRLGLGRHTVSVWLKKYGLSVYQGSKRTKRSKAERDRIAREIVSGKLSIPEVQLKYNIECRDTVTLMVRQYKRDQYSLISHSAESATGERTMEAIKPATEALALAELKVRALETMLDLASKEFKVDIRKKYGAKQ